MTKCSMFICAIVADSKHLRLHVEMCLVSKSISATPHPPFFLKGLFICSTEFANKEVHRPITIVNVVIKEK